jgi:predicted nucleic acid-binding protein
MLNAVADSTVLVSAFLRKDGVSAVLLRHAAGGSFALSLSHAIVTETETVLLEREHIRRRYPYSNEDEAAFCQTLQGSLPLLTDLPPLTGIVRDPNDDMVLATARAAHATDSSGGVSTYYYAEITEQVMMQIDSGELLLSAYGFAEYEDTRGNPYPPTRFCVFWEPKQKTASYCDTRNTVL